MSEGHDGLTFVELLDVVASCYPHVRGHIVCDNLFAHDTDGPKSWSANQTATHGGPS